MLICVDKKSVLVVEDNNIWIRQYGDLVPKFFGNVDLSFSDGAEDALRKAEEKDFDLYITNSLHGRFNNFYRELKSVRPGARVVLITISEFYEGLAKSLGIDYCSKGDIKEFEKVAEKYKAEWFHEEG